MNVESFKLKDLADQVPPPPYHVCHKWPHKVNTGYLVSSTVNTHNVTSFNLNARQNKHIKNKIKQKSLSLTSKRVLKTILYCRPSLYLYSSVVVVVL